MYSRKSVTLVPEDFFSLGATELSGEAAMASLSPISTILTFLAAGEREDLWHPGYKSVDCFACCIYHWSAYSKRFTIARSNASTP